MNSRTKALVAGVSLAVLCMASSTARADGMPYGVTPPATSSVIPDTPDNTDTINTTGVTNVATSNAAQGAGQLTPAQLPKPLPPVPADSVVKVQPNTAFFGLSVGEYDPFRHSDHATSFNAELQPGIKVLGVLQPLFGAMATTKGSAMAYAGLGVPFHITRHIFLMPSAALGLYRAGGGYDLGRTVVGRFGAEIAYQFNDKSRLGLNFDVITNGKSLRANDRTEMLALTYTRPFNLFSGASHGMSAPDVSPASAPAVSPSASAAPAPAAAPVAPVSSSPAAASSAQTPVQPSGTIAPAPATSTTLTPAEQTAHDFP